jgi:hypothetical protein
VLDLAPSVKRGESLGSLRRNGPATAMDWMAVTSPFVRILGQSPNVGGDRGPMTLPRDASETASIS